MDLHVLMQGITNCECGKNHACPMNYVMIGHDVLKSLTDICKKYHKILMVSDSEYIQGLREGCCRDSGG